MGFKTESRISQSCIAQLQLKLIQPGLCAMETFSGAVTLLKSFCLPSEKGSILIGNNLFRMGANSSLLEQNLSKKSLM